LQNALASARRLFELMDEPAEPVDDEHALTLKEATGEVSFEHVGFSYRPDVPLIKALSTSVRPGQRVAIVGPTGCRKATLINLLRRFYDIQKGRLLISGYPLAQIT